MSCALGRLEDGGDRLLARRQVGREAALVAHAGGEATLVQELSEPMEGLGADPQRLGERRRARRHDHELLEVERVLRVGAAVDDVQHRDGEHAGVLAAEPAVERHAGLERRRLRDGQGDAEDRVRAEPRLVLGPVQLDEQPSTAAWSAASAPASAGPISRSTFSTARRTPLPR